MIVERLRSDNGSSIGSATLSSPYLVSSYLSLPLSLTHTLTNQTKPSSRIEISVSWLLICIGPILCLVAVFTI
ncbi:hypothetical protein AAZX31_03G119600 [Glycine max]